MAGFDSNPLGPARPVALCSIRRRSAEDEGRAGKELGRRPAPRPADPRPPASRGRTCRCVTPQSQATVCSHPAQPRAPATDRPNFGPAAASPRAPRPARPARPAPSPERCGPGRGGSAARARSGRAPALGPPAGAGGPVAAAPARGPPPRGASPRTGRGGWTGPAGAGGRRGLALPSGLRPRRPR